MENLKLPLINNDRKTYHDFYSVCIKAIKDNKERVSNKSECIKSIENLRDRRTIKKKTHYFSKTYLNSLSQRKDISSITIKKLNKNKRLSEIILECKNLEAKLLLQKKPSKQLSNLEREDINIIEKNAKNQEKKNSLKRTLSQNKELIRPRIRGSLKIGQIKLSKDNIKKTNKLSKFAIKLKKILEYFESNNITLYEYLENNPFQEKPYQIPKSFEFIKAVKFKDYKFVREALHHSSSYLFCFDYYGQTCYHWAAKLGYIQMLTLLIDYGKHHNQKDFKGRTPLYLAAVNNDRNVCEMLVRNRANVHLRDYNGLSAADVAGSKELKYYLGDLMTQPFSNPNYKKKIADFLRDKNNRIQELRKMEKMKKAEEEEKLKKEKEEQNKENDEEE